MSIFGGSRSPRIPRGYYGSKLTEPLRFKQESFVAFSDDEMVRAGVRRIGPSSFQEVGSRNTINAEELRGRLANLPAEKAPPLPAAPPDVEGRADEAARKSREDTRRRKGARAATIFTGPLGITGPAPVSRKTLLGS